MKTTGNGVVHQDGKFVMYQLTVVHGEGCTLKKICKVNLILKVEPQLLFFFVGIY